MAEDQIEAPQGISSLLDTDLYKLTMQSAVLKHFPDATVSYALTNRTPSMQLNLEAFEWLQEQVGNLGQLRITEEEIKWLGKTCSYFGQAYLAWLQKLGLRPEEQVELKFERDSKSQYGNLIINVHGLWSETILYEIPLLALISEAYFRFVDRDWSHHGQIELAKNKGLELLQAGCVFSEFGSRRRRDCRTHVCVMQGLVAAAKEGSSKGLPGKLTGTSNVHLAMRFGVNPVGTVAHEWFMGIAALTGDYAHANEKALQCWVETFGPGVLAVALTDTFGTPSFLSAFAKPMTAITPQQKSQTYAEAFTGVRQDSGDPLEFVKLMRDFYQAQDIKASKTIIFSDSLNVEKCVKYKHATEEAGLTPSFGVGTHFTNDFTNSTTGDQSVPMNIVIKLSSLNGNPTIKLSDNKGKNMGPSDLIEKVKHEIGYTEKQWSAGDEAHRWDNRQ